MEVYVNPRIHALFGLIALLTPLYLGQGGCEEDADEDGWTIAEGDCDDLDANTHPGADELCDGQDNNCDGVSDADSTDCSGTSCAEILATQPEAQDGLYWVDPTGSGAAVETWCDMTTDGGGWTLVQRTVWDWSDSATLMTGYGDWYGSNLGNPEDGNAYRMAGELWGALNGSLDHMLTHRFRDASDASTCEPLFYLGQGGTLIISSTEATISGLTADVTMMDGGQLSTTDSGASSDCVTERDAVPWFYANCCTTCPTYGAGYWDDSAHPMVPYGQSTADYYGNTIGAVCPSGSAEANANGSSYRGLNAMEYYVR